MSRWQTPESDADPARAITLYVPGGEDWEQIVRGALAVLTLPASFEQSAGGKTPEETALEYAAALLVTFGIWSI